MIELKSKRIGVDEVAFLDGPLIESYQRSTLSKNAAGMLKESSWIYSEWVQRDNVGVKEG